MAPPMQSYLYVSVRLASTVALAILLLCGALGVAAAAGRRTLPRSRFQFQRATADHRVEENMDAGRDLSLATVDQLRAARQRPARTVLYPMSGFDAGTAARLYPDADLIIGVDNHAFLPDALPAKIKVPKVGLESATYFRNLDLLGTVGVAAIGQLRTAVRGFRLRGVTTFTTQEPLGEREAHQWFAGGPISYGKPKATGLGTARHAIVSFDRGAGTKRQRYLHVQSGLFAGAERAWWLDLAIARGLDGVLVKGSEDQLQQFPNGPLDPFVARMIDALEANHGELLSDTFTVRRGQPRKLRLGETFGYNWGGATATTF